jgi:succinate-acetate transporter protein
MIPAFMERFLQNAFAGIENTNRQYPFIAYGSDWLAFAHLVIAMAFIGPYRDPVKNKWVIEWAMLACIAVIPLALIAGPIRQIPFYWRMIDCSFGIFGIIPLMIVRNKINKLEKIGGYP